MDTGPFSPIFSNGPGYEANSVTASGNRLVENVLESPVEGLKYELCMVGKAVRVITKVSRKNQPSCVHMQNTWLSKCYSNCIMLVVRLS